MRKLALLMLLAASVAPVARAQTTCQAAEVYFNAASNSIYYHCPNSTGWIRVPLSGGGGGGGGGATTFDMIQSGTNTSASMVVGSGASMSATGTGSIAATTIPFAGVQSGSSTATLNIDTGGALAATGSGTITATAVPWTGIFSFPSACPSGQFVTAIGLTSTCATPSGTLTANNIWTGTNSFTNSVTFSGNITGVLPICTNSSFTATPNYAMSFDNCQIMTLTSNVTSITISGTPTARTALYLKFPQDGTGGHTVTWPANFIFPTGWALKTGANNNNDMAWQFDGTNWWPISDWGTGSGGGGGGTPGGSFGDPQCNILGGFGRCDLTAASSTSTVSIKPNMTGASSPGVEPNTGGIQYVSTTGNDSNDGLSWGSAKKTINAGLCSLPYGLCGTSPRVVGMGTVYYQDGVFADANPNYGIWIAGCVGPGDSSCVGGNVTSPPAGFMAQYAYGVSNVVCATHPNGASNDTGTKCTVNGGPDGRLGSNTVPNSNNKPFLWLSGVAGGYYEGFAPVNYGPLAWVGVDSNGTPFGNPGGGGTTGQTISVWLDNMSCGEVGGGNPGIGPCVIEGAGYWNRFSRIRVGGNLSETLLMTSFTRSSNVVTVTVNPSFTTTYGCQFVTGDIVSIFGITSGDASIEGTWKLTGNCSGTSTASTFTFNQTGPDVTNSSPGGSSTVISDRAWGGLLIGSQIRVEDTHAGGSGWKFYGPTNANLVFDHAYMEGDVLDAPMVYLSAYLGGGGLADIKHIFLADISYMKGVINEGVQAQISMSSSSDINGTKGVGLIMNEATSFNRNINLFTNSQVGFYGWYNYVEAPTMSARRLGAPAAVRFPNLATNSWNCFGGGQATQSGGYTDPFGGTGAVNLHSTSGTQATCFYTVTQSYNVNDHFVSGVWVRTADGSSLAQPVLIVSLQGLGSGAGDLCYGNASANSNIAGDGGWQWVSATCGVWANPTQPSTVTAYLFVSAAHDLQVYAPVFMKIPSGSISNDELSEYVNYLPYGLNWNASAGDVAFYPSQHLCLPSNGSSVFCGYLSHSNTANRTWTMPDASGTVCLTSTCGGSSGTWNGIGNPVGVGNLNLTMYNGSVNYTSAWNFTGAGTLTGIWNWNNITAATSGTSQPSPQTQWCGNAWHAAASVTDCLGISVTPGNGTDAAITWNFAHVGSSTGYVTASFAGGVASGSNGGQGGMILLPEGTIPTTPNPLGAAGQDNCYADSTAHHRLCKDNNGTTMSDTRSPTTSTTNDFASFADTSGAVLQDSGILGTNLVTQTSNAAANQICAYTGINKICVPTTTLPTAAVPAFSGSVSNSAGSLTMTLASQYLKLYCSPGLGDGLNAIPAGTYLQFSCVNKSGVTWTITGISCWTDNAGTSTLNAANNAATGLLTGAVTCNNTKSGGGATGTQSATTTIANNDAISFTFVADGTTKQTTWTVSFTQ